MGHRHSCRLAASSLVSINPVWSKYSNSLLAVLGDDMNIFCCIKALQNPSSGFSIPRMLLGHNSALYNRHKCLISHASIENRIFFLDLALCLVYSAALLRERKPVEAWIAFI